MIRGVALWLMVVMLASGTMVQGEELGALYGSVVDSISGAPIGGADVQLLGTAVVATTGPDGAFRFTMLRPGTWRVRIEADGYETVTSTRLRLTRDNLEMSAGTYTLTPLAALETTIEVTAERAFFEEDTEVSRNTLTGEQVTRTPGGLEDVSRVLGTMPGVVQESSFTSLLYIRGGDASETVSYLDSFFMGGTEHFGGVFTVFNNELIENVDFYAGGFPARFVNVLSGVIDVEYRTGRRDRIGGNTEISFLSSKFTIEGPLNDRGDTFIVGLRRTYVDGVIKAAGLDNGNVVVPYFGDYYGKLSFALDESNVLETLVLVTEDGAEIEEVEDESLPDAPAGEGRARDEQIIAGVNWKHLFNNGIFMSNQFFFSGRRLSGDLTGTNPYSADVFDRTYVLFGDLVAPLGERHKLRAGYLASYFNFSLDALVDDISTELSGGNTQFPTIIEDKITLDPEFRGLYSGVYIEDEITLGDSGIKIRPGLRGDYWFYNEEWTASPRFAASFPLPGDWVLRASTGLYYQYPTNILQVDEDYGNPDLVSEKSIHGVLGVEGLLTEQMKVRVEGWYKDYYDLIMNYDNDEDVATALLSGEELFLNEGEGHAYGVDVFWQKRSSNSWDGYVSYGLAWVRRYNPLHRDNPQWYYPQQDQRHTLSAVLNWYPLEDWYFSFKFQLRSGRPFTPIEGWELIDHPVVGVPVFNPVYGDVNNDRFPLYHSLDVRIERLWPRRTVTWSLFVDLTNAYNAQNLYNYSYDGGDVARGIPPERTEVNHLPILPFIGVGLEF